MVKLLLYWLLLRAIKILSNYWLIKVQTLKRLTSKNSHLILKRRKHCAYYCCWIWSYGNRQIIDWQWCKNWRKKWVNSVFEMTEKDLLLLHLLLTLGIRKLSNYWLKRVQILKRETSKWGFWYKRGGNTVLIVAAISGYLKIVKLLIAKGAIIEAREK